MSPATSTEDGEETNWWDVGQNPDVHDDLGYEMVDLDVIHHDPGQRDQVLVLPADEDMLRDDAFMVADADDILDLETMV
ncbi:hypothetical protein [Halobacterium jilantaiense]|uniref:Uncharacterized protein n=1 Tax=Halobacterium jilantaiense TaxID=355548 RepID=A0A1I0MPD2_9EURY|nr:hypothetical protein [Halobacterium jilantaiense]SEV90358.1 hypothetical protein SAMN04487945_0256 [Halobacterium jilantaiense]